MEGSVEGRRRLEELRAVAASMAEPPTAAHRAEPGGPDRPSPRPGRRRRRRGPRDEVRRARGAAVTSAGVAAGRRCGARPWWPRSPSSAGSRLSPAAPGRAPRRTPRRPPRPTPSRWTRRRPEGPTPPRARPPPPRPTWASSPMPRRCSTGTPRWSAPRAPSITSSMPRRADGVAGRQRRARGRHGRRARLPGATRAGATVGDLDGGRCRAVAGWSGAGPEQRRRVPRGPRAGRRLHDLCRAGRPDDLTGQDPTGHVPGRSRGRRGRIPRHGDAGERRTEPERGARRGRRSRPPVLDATAHPTPEHPADHSPAHDALGPGRGRRPRP